MLITRDLMSKMEKYFINYPKRIKIIQSKNLYAQNRDNESNVKEITTADYDAKMFKVVEKTINYFQKNKEKSFFINKCIIHEKTWEQAYDDFHIERRTYFSWKREILSDAVIYALLEQLLDLNSNT